MSDTLLCSAACLAATNCSVSEYIQNLELSFGPSFKNSWPSSALHFPQETLNKRKLWDTENHVISLIEGLSLVSPVFLSNCNKTHTKYLFNLWFSWACHHAWLQYLMIAIIISVLFCKTFFETWYLLMIHPLEQLFLQFRVINIFYQYLECFCIRWALRFCFYFFSNTVAVYCFFKGRPWSMVSIFCFSVKQFITTLWTHIDSCRIGSQRTCLFTHANPFSFIWTWVLWAWTQIKNVMVTDCLHVLHL